mmetsp:Transcript_74703/g.206006  ORF Transcript_74703/g.206006 Transcript_74703/m.206006 type:complete len:436 (-) Transcript_74703:47-1354(-)
MLPEQGAAASCCTHNYMYSRACDTMLRSHVTCDRLKSSRSRREVRGDPARAVGARGGGRRSCDSCASVCASRVPSCLWGAVRIRAAVGAALRQARCDCMCASNANVRPWRALGLLHATQALHSKEGVVTLFRPHAAQRHPRRLHRNPSQVAASKAHRCRRRPQRWHAPSRSLRQRRVWRSAGPPSAAIRRGGKAAQPPSRGASKASLLPAVLAGDALERLSRLVRRVGHVRARRVEPAAALDEARADLDQDRLDGVGGAPAGRREQLHADGAADGHVARVEGEARRDDAHKGRLHREASREDDLELDGRLRRVARRVRGQLGREGRAVERGHVDGPPVAVVLVGQLHGEPLRAPRLLQSREPYKLAHDHLGRRRAAAAARRQSECRRQPLESHTLRLGSARRHCFARVGRRLRADPTRVQPLLELATLRAARAAD